MRIAKPVQLSSDDDRRLRILSNRKRIEARFQMRTRIVLLAAKGMSDKDIAQKLLTDRRVAARWRARFLVAGVDGLLQDAARRGALARPAKPPTSKRWFASRSRRLPQARLTGAPALWPSISEPTPPPWPASGAPMV